MHHLASAPRVLALGLLLAAVVAGVSSLPPTARADHDSLGWHHYGIVSSAAGFDRGPATVFADEAGSLYVFYTTTSTTSGLSNLNVTKFATRSADRPVRLFDTQVNRNQSSVWGTMAPSVAMDATGALYVAYAEIRSGLSAEVYVSKSVDGGVTWLPEVRANGAAAVGSDDHPSIAVAGNGNIFVAWRQSWGFARDVTASVSMDGGLSFGRVQNISGPSTSSVTSAVSVTTDSMGRAYVVYDDVDFARGNVPVVNFTRSDDGASWSAPRNLSGPNANIFLPTIKADDQDRLHAAWIDSRGNMVMLWYTRSDDRGDTWSAPVVISQNAAQPTVANVRTSIGISGGTLMVAWTASQGGTSGLAYAISPDRGDRWDSERFFAVPSFSTKNAVVDADENGTFYAAPSQALGSPSAVFLEYWFGPPTPPTVTLFPSGLAEIEVRWTGAPEPNVAGYRVWHSLDGVNYRWIASTGPVSRNYTDRGLVNGTHWYFVQAVNQAGFTSHPSVPVRGTAATTPDAQIALLEAEIAALRAELSSLNDTSSKEAQELQKRIEELESRLNTLQTPTRPPEFWIANINTIALIVTIGLLALVLVMQFRRPKRQPPAAAPEPLPPEEPSEAQLEQEFEELERELEEFPELEEEAPVEPSVPEFEEEL
jgi:hypothetical protein